MGSQGDEKGQVSGETVNIRVGERIRRERKNRRMTLQQLADRIHKSRASMSKYEKGEVSLDVETLTERLWK